MIQVISENVCQKRLDGICLFNLCDGDLRQRYCGKIIDNIYKNLDRPIKFCAIC